MPRYIALFDKADDAYGASFPDLPGCTAMGKSFDEAHESAFEALHEWAADRIASGEPLPAARSYEALRLDPSLTEDFSTDTVTVMMAVHPSGERPVRVNVLMEAQLVARIDRAAKKRGLTRSAFLASAAREKIGARR